MGIQFQDECGVFNTWLIIAIWCADNWISISFSSMDNKAMLGDLSSAQILEDLCGSKLVEAIIIQHGMQLVFEKEGKQIYLTIDPFPDRRPCYPGTNGPREFSPEDDLRKSVFLSPTPLLWI